MRISAASVLLLILCATFLGCSSAPKAPGSPASSDGTQISALGAIGRTESAYSGPLFAGDG
ncbi:MAG: hypothetical protein FWF29_09465 [Treponema sp.]|nr:hypothetical protein [Treponema sp.]